MAFVSTSNNNNTSTNRAVSTAQAVNTANEVSTASTQVNTTNSSNVDNLSDAVIYAFLASQPNRLKDSGRILEGGLQSIAMRILALTSSKWSATTATRRDILLGNAELQGIKTTKTRKSDQAKEGPNYALMAYSSPSSNSEVSNNLIVPKILFEKLVETLKSQYDQLHKDFKKSELMVLAYKSGLESLEEKLEVYKENESIYSQDIKIVDNYKKGLGYNAVPPPYTGNFMPPTPDLSFTGLDEFVNEPVVENSKAMSSEEEPKVVRKNNDAPIIEEWVSDSEEENVSQTKTEKKTVKPSIAKIEFVKPKQQEKTARKTVKQVEKHRQNTHNPRGNQRNWNNMMS
ncbi:hypothetical protein Tco_0750296 [Tanacetum coccineum]|uniref:Uncharacterized protein n=1 Tax=Tanacetum coccineum TaxID=301880 RepID=A0ABQ4Z3P6_9ASTR